MDGIDFKLIFIVLIHICFDMTFLLSRMKFSSKWNVFCVIKIHAPVSQDS